MGEVTRRVCKNIRFLRLKNDLTQCELARKASISKRYLLALEKGRSNVTVATVERIAKALDEKPESLLCSDVHASSPAA